MYDEIYDLLVEKGIAAKLDQETWFNNSGNIVEYEEEAVGSVHPHPPRKVPVS